MKSIWINVGNRYMLGESSHQVNKLNPGVYRLDYDQLQGLFLTKTGDEFKMPSKLYGSDSEFADRCVKTYHATKGNMGILLNGVKGTGKTVTAQLICNKLQLPVIVVHDKQEGLPTFLNTIQQDVVVMVDEYEKIYSHYDYSILTVMDGVLSTTFRRLFLLTTNDSHVNHNMLQRPSRIRYVKEFVDLDRKTIEEVVDDLLINKELRNDVIEYLSMLETITIDIAKSMIEEVNIHNESPIVFGSFFNTKKVDNQFIVYSINDDGNGVIEEKLIHTQAVLSPAKITKNDYGKYLYINGNDVGYIRSIMGSIVIYEDYDQKMVTLRIESASYKHKAFAF